MIELDQHHRAVNAVIEHAVRFRPSDPCKPSVVEMPFYRKTALVQCCMIATSAVLRVTGSFWADGKNKL